MFELFILKAIIAGVGVAMLAGPIGSVIVWKKMTFFGDALAHSSLLGIALSFILDISMILGVIVFAILFALIIGIMQSKRKYSNDTLLAILSHGSLAMGLVSISFINSPNIDLVSFLFGDILSVSTKDIYFIYISAFISIFVLFIIWQSLIMITINEDLAQIEGVNIVRTKTIFMILIALFVALAIKVVGALLLTSLLVIPTATARNFADNPEKMALISSLIGAISVIVGIYFSLYLDIPTGPSIVLVAVILFILSNIINLKKPRHNS